MLVVNDSPGSICVLKTTKCKLQMLSFKSYHRCRGKLSSHSDFKLMFGTGLLKHQTHRSLHPTVINHQWATN